MRFDIKSAYPLLFLIIMSVIVLRSRAQTNMAFYPIDNQFNSSGFNPAFLTSKAQFTFSIFPLAGTNLAFNNQKEIRNLINTLLSGKNKDNEYIDIVKSMVNRSMFNQNFENELFAITYRSSFGFLNFRVRENLLFSASVKGSVSEFMILPETQSVIVDQVQSIPAQIIHYREYSIAYSMSPKNHKFTAGIRAKLYFGKSVFSSEIFGEIRNKTEFYALETWGKGYMSMPERATTKPDGTQTGIPDFSNVGSYFMNSGNPGIGVDLGLKYKITPKLLVSMSVIDLGKIFWKTNLNSKIFDGEYRIKDKSITSQFDQGVEVISKTSDSVSFTNSVSNVFNLSYVKSKFSTQF